ncbi:MAG: glycosyltransferase family 2 protein [Caldilineaceae bacterium]|nr:glycosyltransferase family 2 protein [Caldilineaceae bacterium]
MNHRHPRVTFGMIVLNGEPFTRYNLRALYPLAHQIIVVEGAAPGAATIATADGHSTDGTLQTLRDFKQFEDPEDKLTIVTAEDAGYPNGFWPGEKHEQSQAYAQRATGDYLWQVDVDEFYRPEDMQAILDALQADPTIAAISFKQIQFWGGFSSYVDSWYLHLDLPAIHRIFKWGKGYQYSTHRPPTVLTAEGVDTRTINWLSEEEMARRGIYLYHYSLVLPKQVIEKCEYYGKAAWAERAKAQEWAQEVFLALKHPYRVHNVYDYPGWLERFTGQHPPVIEALQRDLRSGELGLELRQTDDIEALLASRRYQLGRWALKVMAPWGRYLTPALWRYRLKGFSQNPVGYLTRIGKRLLPG